MSPRSRPTAATGRAAGGVAGSAARLTLWAAGLALAVRLAAFAQEVGSPFLGVPLLDERYYDGAARALLGWPGGIVLDGFRPLLYPALLAALYGGAGPHWGPVAAIVAQHLLGAASGVLVALLAWRLSGREAAGLAAGVLWALAAPPLFAEGQLLTETLFVALGALQLLLLAGSPRLGRRAAAGAVAGLAAQVRSNALLLAVAFGVMALIEARRDRTGAARRALVALGALAAVHLAAAWAQAPLQGGFRLLPSSGGVNLYLGNERGADGMMPRQDAPAIAGEVYRDSVQAWSEREFAAAPSGAAAPGGASRYWLARTGREIAACPACWLRLVARKVALLAWNEEVPNHRSFRFAAGSDLPLLAWLPVRWWVLLALAPIGAWWVRRAGDRIALAGCLAFVLVHAAGVVAFFVADRYRLVLWPPLVALSGCALVALAGWTRERRWRALAAAAAAAGAAALLSLGRWTAAEVPPPARDHFFRSYARLAGGDVGGALADARRSVELEPLDAAAQVQLGNAAVAAGELETALAAYQRALALDPRQPIAWTNLGLVLERLDRPGPALDAFGRALVLDPGSRPARAGAERLGAAASPPPSS